MANNTTTTQLQNPNSILNAFKNKFATKVNAVYVNSLKREVNFREVSVTEQKTLSKTMIENESRRDIVYDTQCALINRLCLENDSSKVKEEAREAARAALPDSAMKDNIDLNTAAGAAYAVKFTNDFIQSYVMDHSFDIYSLTEFDRIRILMEIYQRNYFKDEITYKCKECGTENKYFLDFSKIIDKLNEFSLDDKTCTLEDKNYVYNFVLNYPKVKTVSQFYKSYVKKYKGTTSKEKDFLDDAESVDYANLYIKKIELIDKEKGDKEVADLTYMTYEDIERLISMFPQNVIYDEEKGLIRYIAKELIFKINSVFTYEKCAQCGAEAPIGLGGVSDFL